MIMNNAFLMSVSSSSTDQELDGVLTYLTTERDELIEKIVSLRWKKVAPGLSLREKKRLARLQKDLVELAPSLALAAYEKARRQQFVIDRHLFTTLR